MEKKGADERFQLVNKKRYRVLREEVDRQHYAGRLIGLLGVAMCLYARPYQGLLAAPSTKAWGAAGIALATCGLAIWSLVKQIRGRLDECDRLDLTKENVSATFKRLEEEAQQQRAK